jgi:hypothetical protein
MVSYSSVAKTYGPSPGNQSTLVPTYVCPWLQSNPNLCHVTESSSVDIDTTITAQSKLRSSGQIKMGQFLVCPLSGFIRSHVNWRSTADSIQFNSDGTNPSKLSSPVCRAIRASSGVESNSMIRCWSIMNFERLNVATIVFISVCVRRRILIRLSLGWGAFE